MSTLKLEQLHIIVQRSPDRDASMIAAAAITANTQEHCYSHGAFNIGLDHSASVADLLEALTAQVTVMILELEMDVQKAEGDDTDPKH